MAVAKRKRKTFYASVHVTRIEEWRVEAATADEARALLRAATVSAAKSASVCTSKFKPWASSHLRAPALFQ